ncbi:hypothetical protein TNCT_134461 [Trichonephila clavata]|uniref:Uncharacterized protein n=1 Tax=Trichonephila clavata TaxID=2740835 RepID=A0A8X6LTW7_TRICU|nr:hypothetical protein TNCT_134461 [Trichonephila clavata]
MHWHTPSTHAKPIPFKVEACHCSYISSHGNISALNLIRSRLILKEKRVQAWIQFGSEIENYWINPPQDSTK